MRRFRYFHSGDLLHRDRFYNRCKQELDYGLLTSSREHDQTRLAKCIWRAMRDRRLLLGREASR